MSFELTVARRHLRALRHRRRVSFAALMSVAGVCLGVAALAIVMSVSNGFSRLLWDRLLGVSAHVTVLRQFDERIADYGSVVAAASSVHGVTAAEPYIRSEGLVIRRSASGGTYSAGVVVQGMDVDGLVRATRIREHMWAGDLSLEEQPHDGRGRVYGMTIGRYLADRIGAMLGSEVHLGILPEAVGVGPMPEMRRYIVTGIFDTGFPEFDSGLVFISLAACRRDMGWGDEVSGVRIRLGDPLDAERVAAILSERLGMQSAFVVSSWITDHASLYSSIRTEKWAFFLALTLIVVVAGFNIVSILTMSVAERRREVGILKAMGCTRRSIGRIFTLQGLAMGGAGILLGNLLGIALCWVQMRYEVVRIPGDLFIIQALPVDMRALDFAVISVSALVLCYLFTRLPARDAAALDPVESIRM